MRCLIQNIITSEPQLQFQWKKLQNVALVAGLNLHSFSSLNYQKREFYGHFSGAHLFKKNSNIWKYHETNISCAHILELYIFPWRVQTVDLDCAWRFKTYVSRLAEAWRHRDNPPCELIIDTGPNSCIAMSDTKFTNILLCHASPLHVSTWSILIECASWDSELFIKAQNFNAKVSSWSMEHSPHELHLSIHNYADSGGIHNLSLSHFSAQRTSV